MTKPLTLQLKDAAADVNFKTQEGFLEFVGARGECMQVHGTANQLRSVANVIDQALLTAQMLEVMAADPQPDPTTSSSSAVLVNVSAIGVTAFSQGGIALDVKQPNQPTLVLVLSRELAAQLRTGLAQILMPLTQ